MLPLSEILPPPNPPCRSMLPGSPAIQPLKEPAVPVRSIGTPCATPNRPSTCRVWFGACALSVAFGISTTTGGRPAPSDTVRTESRISTVLIHGKAATVRSRSDRLSPGWGPDPSGGGSISRLASPTSLRSTSMSAPSSRIRPIFTSPRNSENGSRKSVRRRTRARSGREPQAAFERVTPSATIAGSLPSLTVSGTRAASSRPVTLRTCSVNRA